MNRPSQALQYLFLATSVCLFSFLPISPTALGATVGVDNVHGFNADTFLGSGSAHNQFRAEITGAGHTIVPLSSFNSANLAGLDAVILTTAYSQNASSTYSNSEIADIQSFVERAVFLDDQTLLHDPGPGVDRPISFGDNRRLVQNILGFLSSGGGALFLGENGSGFNIGNMNALVAPYGVSYASGATDSGGRTVRGFVSHPVTAGLQQIGVDFHLPMTITGPAIDLTTGSGSDNVLAVFDAIPEPASLLLCALGTLGLLAGRRR